MSLHLFFIRRLNNRLILERNIMGEKPKAHYNLDTGMTTLEVKHEGKAFISAPIKGEVSDEMAQHINDFHFDQFEEKGNGNEADNPVR